MNQVTEEAREEQDIQNAAIWGQQTYDWIRQVVMTSTLFTVFMDVIKECAPSQRKLNVGYKNLKPVLILEGRFADVVTIMVGKQEHPLNNLLIWNQTLTKHGMKFTSKRENNYNR